MTTCQKINIFPSENCYNAHVEECGENDLNLLPLKEVILNMFFPVGSHYFSGDNGFNPNTSWGGTWVKIENAFLYGSGSKSVGETGGEENVTLSLDQIPTHTHTRNNMNIIGGFTNNGHASGIGAWGSFTCIKNGKLSNEGAANDGGEFAFDASLAWSGNTSAVGGDESHNNMPPYIVVNIWKRTA